MEGYEDTESYKSYGSGTLQKKIRCRPCQSLFKSVLRVIMKEEAFRMRVLLIRFDISDGIVIFCSQKAIDFVKVNHDKKQFSRTCEKWMSEMNLDENRQQYRDSASDYQDDQPILRRATICCIPHCSNNNSRIIKGSVMSFVNRLTDNLELSKCAINQSIENVLTTSQEVLVDFNLQELISFSEHTEEEILRTIINLFWKPKIASRRSCSAIDYLKNHSWFEAVDYGRVAPFYLKLNPYISGFSDNLGKSLRFKCIHEIEQLAIKTYSWYFVENFYHNFTPSHTILSYSQYLNYIKSNKICNQKVMIVKDTPTDLDINICYIVTEDLFLNSEYIRKYVCYGDDSIDSIIHVDKSAPFVVHSLNPITRTHIFHMVYKKRYSKPYYEHIYNTLILLKDAMCKLQLHEVAVHKIHCSSENFDFGIIVKMIDHIFFYTNIRVRVGLNLKYCH